MTTQGHVLDFDNSDAGVPPAAQAMLPPARSRRGRGLVGRAHGSAAAFFLLPNIVLVALFLLVPLAMSLYYSFQRLDPLGGSQFLGVNNYADLFADGVFWQSLLNTAIFTVATVPVGMALGLGLAVLLNGVLPGRTLYRSIIFLPLVISGVATGVLGTWMFDQYNGFFNKALDAIGIGSINWQSDGHWAMTSLVLMTLWQRVGFDMLIYLAGLQGVSPDLLEAAELDGASPWRRFRDVTFPLLGPSTFFLLVMNVIYSFQVFDTVWAMTRGGPGYSTTTVVTYAYRQSFDDHGPQLLGYGAAIGMVIYVITLLITVAQWRLSRNRDQTG
ncbi:multiple sugar transport system permease protein [Jatrophihabitans endophyticus]|uniref:Multiple sugar transport system permease protein n=1 Tax=Jatrophihabitans endophyticus TaxID=1206085 RepID=A0A1M5CKC4_9ACTN|nr:sugar ABC transporter permease [Jatrophihabitans endophyticus]SHF55170.1 multiple sugar transport system permease protein [Jatrophihabitans endophyticus]